MISPFKLSGEWILYYKMDYFLYYDVAHIQIEYEEESIRFEDHFGDKGKCIIEGNKVSLIYESGIIYEGYCDDIGSYMSGVIMGPNNLRGEWQATRKE
ncbi:MAG: hypothetical protein JRI44_02550 [Deltaproteobacteria bacterium]|nr:hypothetical protein [Deltaproteobacteria bacterium]